MRKSSVFFQGDPISIGSMYGIFTYMWLAVFMVHPWRLTWNLQITHLDRIPWSPKPPGNYIMFSFQGVHVAKYTSPMDAMGWRAPHKDIGSTRHRSPWAVYTRPSAYRNGPSLSRTWNKVPTQKTGRFHGDDHKKHKVKKGWWVIRCD